MLRISYTDRHGERITEEFPQYSTLKEYLKATFYEDVACEELNDGLGQGVDIKTLEELLAYHAPDPQALEIAQKHGRVLTRGPAKQYEPFRYRYYAPEDYPGVYERVWEGRTYTYRDVEVIEHPTSPAPTPPA